MYCICVVCNTKLFVCEYSLTMTYLILLWLLVAVLFFILAFICTRRLCYIAFEIRIPGKHFISKVIDAASTLALIQKHRVMSIDVRDAVVLLIIGSRLPLRC